MRSDGFFRLCSPREFRCLFVKAPLVLHSPVVVFSTECNTVRNLLLQLYRRSQLERGAPHSFSVLPEDIEELYPSLKPHKKSSSLCVSQALAPLNSNRDLESCSG